MRRQFRPPHSGLFGAQIGTADTSSTPVDRTVHVSLEAIEAIHVDWQDGVRQPGREMGADLVRRLELKPTAVTAALVGLKSKISIFTLQRFVNTYRSEPLSASAGAASCAAGAGSSNDADWARPSASHRRSMSTFSRCERLSGISRPRAAAR